MLVLAEQNRTFGYAAAASVALHGAVLLMNAPPMREALVPPPEPPLIARLAEPAPPPRVEPETPPAPPPAPAPAPQKRVAKTKPKPKPAPRPSEPVAAPESEPQLEAKTMDSPAETDSTQSEAPAPAAAPPVATIAPSPPAAPDPGEALARFRQQLVDLAVRYKRYPRVALDNGWTGDVQVRIDMAPSGAVSAVTVRTSSGYEILDAQALEMFRKAAPQVAVPAALRGKAFSVDVRAIYNLQDRPG
jgi:protein TonB